MEDFGQAALEYAELGYRVFPCVSDKNPSPLTSQGFKDASTDADQIRRWWRRYPNACIGIATEGLLVVDIDAPPNPWLSDQPELAVELLAAPTSLTPGGGRHHIFRRPEGKSWSCTVGRLAPHVDTRTDGGYIVVPPSVRPDGAYCWLEGCELECAADRLPEPPAWLVQRLDTLATTPSPALASYPGEANEIPSGQRNATLARLGGAMRRVGMGQAEILAALQQTNALRCSPPISPREVERIAASVCRYAPDEVSVALAENHWEQMMAGKAAEAKPSSRETNRYTDPGILPDHLLRIPGFVSEVMDHCLATAPYPNPTLAFCGALSLQATLASRKVRDAGDNRTNIYLLGLAHSASGKDWPRKLNVRILHDIGMADCVGERFASGEGIQDALFLSPSMLFQTDEIDGLLQSINKSVDGKHESIMSTLLTMYSSANTVYPMRRKAGKDSPGAIDQPSLVIFGTAIPNHYYNALSERMLTNGLFARMIILECGQRGRGQEPKILDVPERVMDTANWWANYQPGGGNLRTWHPVPTIVEHDPRAHALLVEGRHRAEAEYEQAERANDAIGTTVWGRVNEQTRKLALLYAVSADHRKPVINERAAEWAIELVDHLTRRMLFMAASHVAENPFHAECLRAIEKLRQAEQQRIPHSVLLKRMKMDARTFRELIVTLEQRGDIISVTNATSGRPCREYQLVEESGSATTG